MKFQNYGDDQNHDQNHENKTIFDYSGPQLRNLERNIIRKLN